MQQIYQVVAALWSPGYASDFFFAQEEKIAAQKTGYMSAVFEADGIRCPDNFPADRIYYAIRGNVELHVNLMK